MKDNKNSKFEVDLSENLKKIKYKILVLSGKGGVGKSTVAVNLSVYLANQGKKVGLLDIDLHGPSVPKLLKINQAGLPSNEQQKIIPWQYNENLKVISVGLLLNEKDPIIWRGPLKSGAIKQFLQDVSWGELDYLVIDSPPGTGDELLSICQLLDDPKGGVVVTTPQDLALLDVKRSIAFCHKIDLPLIGVVENMSGFNCPHCHKSIDLFKIGGGEKMAQEMDLPFLGKISLDAAIVKSGDEGEPVILNNFGEDWIKVFKNIEKNIGGKK